MKFGAIETFLKMTSYIDFHGKNLRNVNLKLRVFESKYHQIDTLLVRNN